MKTEKMWGGRFRKPMDPLVERFTSSIAADGRLAAYDVAGSIAHATMLGKCRIIPSATAKRLVRELERIQRDIARGLFHPDPRAEDIHSQIEAALLKRLGPEAGMLHTARSRNDQVALDFRLYCRDVVGRIRGHIAALQRVLVEQAAAHRDVVIPGYTHLQRAQPVLLAHHLVAYVEMLARDDERLAESLPRINVLPLGSGALAGTSLPIDRAYVAKLLGFARVSDNSLDAVSDRDFAVELLANLALVAAHLSRLAEDVILWSTEEFGIAALDDAFATGSSLMPQKKNPDVLELIRGQAPLVAGQLSSILGVLKGLPMAYNRDLQWDKPAVFQGVDLVEQALVVLAPLMNTLTIRRERIAQLLDDDSLCATDLAEHLVRRGVPFRQAHQIVGRVVLAADQSGRRLAELSAEELRTFSPHFDGEARRLLDPRASVDRKVSAGGTGPRQVDAAIAKWRQKLTARRHQGQRSDA